MAKMKCPKCEGDIELDRIYSKSADVDQCPKCEGVWFDHVAKELNVILSRGRDEVPEELKDALEADAGRISPAPGKTKKYLCPACGVKLRTYWYASEVGKTFEVDGCTSGCGVWLDDGELGKAFEFLKSADKQLSEYYRSKGIIGRVHLLMQDRKKNSKL